MAKSNTGHLEDRTRFWVKEDRECILLYEETTYGTGSSLRTSWTAREPYESTASSAWVHKRLITHDGEIPEAELVGVREISGEEAAVLLVSGIPGRIALRKAAQILASVPCSDPVHPEVEASLCILAQAAGEDPLALAPHLWLVQLLAPGADITPGAFREPETTLPFDEWLVGEAEELTGAGWPITVEPFSETLSLVQAGPDPAGRYPGVYLRWLMPTEAVEHIPGW